MPQRRLCNINFNSIGYISVIIYFLPDNAVDLMKWYFRAPAYIVSFLAYTSFFITVITFLMVIKRFSTILDN